MQGMRHVGNAVIKFHVRIGQGMEEKKVTMCPQTLNLNLLSFCAKWPTMCGGREKSLCSNIIFCILSFTRRRICANIIYYLYKGKKISKTVSTSFCTTFFDTKQKENNTGMESIKT